MSEKIGICLIGAGRAGMIHGRNFASRIPHAKMTAVVDFQEEQARRAAQELTCPWFTDYREGLRQPGVDAVVIAVPTIYHHDIAVEAARMGKHILCEKPLAMNVEECRNMIREADENGVKLQVGFMRRFDEGFLRAKELIDQGTIGDVVTVRSLTRGPSTPQEWMYDIEKSNGPLAEVNSHDIDMLRWFTCSEVKSLYAMAGNYRCPQIKEQYPDFYDSVLLSLRMENNMMGNIDGAQGVRYGYDARVDILGTRGCITVGDLKSGSAVSYTRENGMCSDVVSSWKDLFRDAYIHEDSSFAECIRKDTKPVVTGYDGLMALAVVKAGNQSIRTGNIVTMNEVLENTGRTGQQV
ncbi:Gfo/Idh/MocA family oxidoreductase [Diplocloster hominis]|uniref:Gfo/Idh/MocA family oxidoreductase n=1 Tax=Diplocloster hominis TaxID=3079010 RepID=UPI0031BB1E9E